MNDRGLRSAEICTRSSGYVCRQPEFPQGLCRSWRNVRLELREIVPETCVKKSSQCDSVASAAVGQPPSSRCSGTTACQGGRRNLQANTQHMPVRLGPTPNVQRPIEEERGEVREQRSEQPSDRLMLMLMLMLEIPLATNTRRSTPNSNVQEARQSARNGR